MMTVATIQRQHLCKEIDGGDGDGSARSEFFFKQLEVIHKVDHPHNEAMGKSS